MFALPNQYRLNTWQTFGRLGVLGILECLVATGKCCFYRYGLSINLAYASNTKGMATVHFATEMDGRGVQSVKMVGVAAQSLAKLTRYWAHPIITHMLIMSLVAWIGARSSANELSLILQIDNERTGFSTGMPASRANVIITMPNHLSAISLTAFLVSVNTRFTAQVSIDDTDVWSVVTGGRLAYFNLLRMFISIITRVLALVIGIAIMKLGRRVVPTRQGAGKVALGTSHFTKVNIGLEVHC
ncbi:hypothetical protein AGABI1DRAFT_83132 [Agaricus bisporus var. burnettii JB137-S8]|uniref:Uncharacterized protein n=1 Tax=Agaricus bisporus var. burnettii (strain JB137-S8 / ATCC MYA-4627 / FGSC 10392) TaxID=597362 RepID=K5XE89_AGABU|nr:uncharacterized protein AGABI1DRAFT_83132 [Agaricus bisporus var. burnettii JB137-S8]EKM81663.1 hypothetical protein AGABI1DRAFT_83132 [Agaricus bisporus var. burnettii JB137-S8]